MAGRGDRRVDDGQRVGRRASVVALRGRLAGVHVDLVSLVPVKRSHSVCAQGGINSVNAVTRQQGDNEWKHFDDTVYGGDFLQHQPPVKEMATRSVAFSLFLLLLLSPSLRKDCSTAFRKQPTPLMEAITASSSHCFSFGASLSFPLLLSLFMSTTPANYTYYSTIRKE